MNVLVTGGAGFIGSHLVKELCKADKVVVIVRDVIPSRWLSEALEKCIIVKGDVLNQGLLRRALSDYQVEQVYHLAAQALVSTAMKDPVTTFETNVVGTANLLEACRQVDDVEILIQSTDKVYGSDRMNVSEDEPLALTIGIYETSKACEDIVARAFLGTYGMRVKIARPSNVYGYDLAPRIVSNTIRSCLGGKAPSIFEGQENTIRQYIYVADVVEALQTIIRNGNSGVFNVGTDDILTQEQVVKTICGYFSLKPITVSRKPMKEIQKQSVNWDKLRALGWTPKFTFAQGIQETIELFKRYGW